MGITNCTKKFLCVGGGNGNNRTLTRLCGGLAFLGVLTSMAVTVMVAVWGQDIWSHLFGVASDLTPILIQVGTVGITGVLLSMTMGVRGKCDRQLCWTAVAFLLGSVILVSSTFITGLVQHQTSLGTKVVIGIFGGGVGIGGSALSTAAFYDFLSPPSTSEAEDETPQSPAASPVGHTRVLPDREDDGPGWRLIEQEREARRHDSRDGKLSHDVGCVAPDNTPVSSPNTSPASSAEDESRPAPHSAPSQVGSMNSVATSGVTTLSGVTEESQHGATPEADSEVHVPKKGYIADGSGWTPEAVHGNVDRRRLAERLERLLC